MRQLRFNPINYGFEWTADGWYRWDEVAAARAAKADRAAEAKALRAEGYHVRLRSNGGQLISRGGIGSGHPHIEAVVTVYVLEARR